MMNEAEVVSLVKAENAGALHKRATDAAGVCKALVLQCTQTIGKKRYVKCEGWQALANAFGCVASARDVEKVETGFRAIGEVKRLSDGMVIASAEGFVGNDEPTWASRPEFARRAMCQTRAISRACRSALAFIIPLIDAGLMTTPAEEMEAAVAAESQPGGTVDLKARLRALGPASERTVEGQRVTSESRLADPRPEPPPPEESHAAAGPRDEEAEATGGIKQSQGGPIGDLDPEGFIPAKFGSGAGKHVTVLTDKSLAWYEGAVASSVDDPSKASYRSKNEALLNAIRNEQQRRAK